MMDTDPATQASYFGGLAWLVKFRSIPDKRGVLQPLHFDQMPFAPCRAFVVTNVPAGVVRGGHAHRFGTQLLLCLQGRIEILMRHRQDEVALALVPASYGLVVGPGVWCEQKYVASDSVLLVFASDPYDANSYSESAT